MGAPYCVLCQRGFKSANSLAAHQRGAVHQRVARAQREQPALFKEQVSKRFMQRFIQFVARTAVPTPLAVAYQRFVAATQMRLAGTRYRTVNDCVPDLLLCADLFTYGGGVYVRGFSYMAHRAE